MSQDPKPAEHANQDPKNPQQPKDPGPHTAPANTVLVPNTVPATGASTSPPANKPGDPGYVGSPSGRN